MLGCESDSVVLSCEGAVFFRIKKSGERSYVQIVENKREGAVVRQTVIANLGRTDELAASGALASLLASGAKLTDQVLLINALAEDVSGALSASAKRIGGPLLFGKIWERLGIGDVLSDLLKDRSFEFAVEHASSCRARIATVQSGWRITTLLARRGSACITSIAPWLGARRGDRRKARGRACAALRQGCDRPPCRFTAKAARRSASTAIPRTTGPI